MFDPRDQRGATCCLNTKTDEVIGYFAARASLWHCFLVTAVLVKTSGKLRKGFLKGMMHFFFASDPHPSICMLRVKAENHKFIFFHIRKTNI